LHHLRYFNACKESIQDAFEKTVKLMHSLRSGTHLNQVTACNTMRAPYTLQLYNNIELITQTAEASRQHEAGKKLKLQEEIV
jgi:hypothetical protein